MFVDQMELVAFVENSCKTLLKVQFSEIKLEILRETILYVCISLNGVATVTDKSATAQLDTITVINKTETADLQIKLQLPLNRDKAIKR